MSSRQRARESVHRRFLENEVTGPGTSLRSCAWCPASVIYLPLDGRNRYRAAQAAGVECPMRDYVGDDPVGFVVSLNLRRRHLSEGQRAWAAAQIARLPRGTNQHSAIALPTQAQAASMLSVSVDGVKRAAVVRDHGVPELQALVARGDAAPSTAAAVARLPEDVKQEIMARCRRPWGRISIGRLPRSC